MFIRQAAKLSSDTCFAVMQRPAGILKILLFLECFNNYVELVFGKVANKALASLSI